MLEAQCTLRDTGYGNPCPEDRKNRLVLVDRLSPEWSLHRVWHLLYVDMLNYDELALMAAIPHLADGWKRYAVRRLENRKVEDWSNRLDGDKS
jgi:hypothetical protein